jgi:hypothetical protein
MKDNIKIVYNGVWCKNVKRIQLVQNMYEYQVLENTIKKPPFSIQK